jgi:hypothetical protein
MDIAIPGAFSDAGLYSLDSGCPSLFHIDGIDYGDSEDRLFT